MRRREFLGVLGGAAATWPLAARAQQAMPMIGLLSALSRPQAEAFLNMFRRGLGEAGFAEGRNVTIEYRWAEGQYDRLPTMAAELVGRPVNLIVAQSPPAALAAKAATSTIPIVFGVGLDPVAAGLVASFNRPGGNATGIVMLPGPLVQKRLELIRELVPKAADAVLLVNPGSPEAAAEVRYWLNGHRARRRPGGAQQARNPVPTSHLSFSGRFRGRERPPSSSECERPLELRAELLVIHPNRRGMGLSCRAQRQGQERYPVPGSQLTESAPAALNLNQASGDQPERALRESVMNNSSMRTADRLTHLKIVVVSLVAGIAVVGVGIAARPTMPDMSTQLEARAPVLKPGPVIWSGSETTSIR